MTMGASELTVQDVMTLDVTTATPETEISEIAHLMIVRRLRAVPVVSEAGAVVGLLTDRDVMDRYLPRVGPDVGAAGDQASGPVREIMQRTVMCVAPDQPVGDVAALMINKDIERFPVVAEGVLVGFLTRGDIIRRLLDHAGPPPETGDRESDGTEDGTEDGDDEER